MDYLNMQHREYDTVNKFSVSSLEFDGSEDELSEEEYYKDFRKFRPASGSRIFHRWLLNMFDIPNNLTNRLRDWLRSTNRGSTSDKSSGTNSITSRIRLTEYEDNSDFYNGKSYKSVKNNHRYINTHTGKKCQAPFDDHSYVKNHHVYHIYKQNKMGIERVVREEHNYSTSWLQKNERWSSSPILVLPRVDPDTGLPIFQPRSQHSRTATERLSLKHKEKKLAAEGWRNSKILQFQENHYTYLRGDSNLIEGLLEKSNTEKTLSTVNDNNNRRFNHNQDNDYEKGKLANFNKINPEDVTSFLGSKDLNVIKNEEKTRSDSTNLEHFSDLEKLSTATQKNVDALLNNLRQKINSLNAEKKSNRPVVHLSGVIDPDTGSRDRNHLLEARWQDKSGLFTRDIKPAYTEARASFTERIQDIWTQEKSSSQWAVLHNHKNIIHGTKSGMKREESIEEQKEIPISDFTTNEMSKNDRVLKMSATQSSINYEMTRPTVCHVGVQYSNSKFLNLNEALRISSSKYVPTLENNENELGMQIPQTPEVSTQPKAILANSIELPSQQKIQAFLQHEISKVATDLIHFTPVVLLESKATTESRPLTADNVQKIVSVDTNNPMNINAENLHFAFSPRKIKADVENESSENIITQKNDPPDEPCPQNSPIFLSISSQNINNKNSQITLQRQRKRLYCPFKGLRKNRLNPSSHFSRSPLRNSRKSRVFACRLPKKIGLWLSNKFHSASGQNSPISDRSSRTLPSTKSSKLTCTMLSIFKCTEKTSEVNVPHGSMTKECQTPMIFQSNEKPMPPIRQKKHEAQSSTVKNDKATSKDEENAANVIIDTKCTETSIGYFSAIEPPMNGNRRTLSKRSMTTLSVTTSNLTNIPLQLLGSTSDTNIVPSHDSQDDFKRQVDKSNATEIITRNKAIETCEETDHYNCDSLVPEGTTEVNEKSEKLEHDGSKKFNDFETPEKIHYSDSDPFLPEDAAEINEELKKIKLYDSKKIKHFKTNEESSDYISDSFLPEINEKIEKSGYDHSREINKCSLKVKTDQKRVTNISSVNTDRKLKTEEKTRQTGSIRKPQQHNSLAQKRRREDVLINSNIDENRSCDVRNFSAERRKYSKIGTRDSDKNTVDRNAQKLKLNRRKSRIDIVVDKSPKEEYKGKRTEISNVHNKILERRESLLNIATDDSSDDAARLKLRIPQKPYNCQEKSSKESKEPQNPARKLRQRTDSPAIPRRATNLQIKRSIAAGKSSLIPVGIGNSRCTSTLSKPSEKITADNSCNKKKLYDNKNEIPALKSSLIAGPSLKKTLTDTEAKEKKNSNYRVRFELKNKSSNEIDIKVNNDRKNDGRYSENLEIDDKRIIRKIKSSLENGEPLKRIKITEPGFISERTAKSSALKLQVEKDVIDQPGETCSSNQNLLRREKMSLISGADNENLYQTYPHRESTLSEQIPKTRGSFEKRHHNESKISYRSPLMEKRKNNNDIHCPIKQTSEALPQFMKCKKPETLKRQSIIDFARIKEQVENEILEQTSRSSGTEDCDCAIVLIKAINSSMELSDA